MFYGVGFSGFDRLCDYYDVKKKKPHPAASRSTVAIAELQRLLVESQEERAQVREAVHQLQDDLVWLQKQFETLRKQTKGVP